MYRIAKPTVLFLFLLIVFACAYRSAIYLPKITESRAETVRLAIDATIVNTDPTINVGIKVVSGDTREVIYEKNPDNRFTPASNTKLFTAVAALNILGPSYRFRSRLYTDSTLVADSLKGNLYLVGSGDPDFTHHDLEEMVKDIKSAGIRHFQGDLVIDNSQFDLDAFGPGWMWDEGAWWYFAPVDAMTINDNCVVVHVDPGRQITDPPVVSIDPATAYISVNIDASTVDQDSVSNLKVERRWKTRENIIDVTGELARGENTRSYFISVETPAVYAGTLLREILTSEGISLGGILRQDTLPRDTLLLSSALSQPLSVSIRNFLKTSDNLTGELLVKKMGAVVDSTTGSWTNGMRAIRTFLQDEVGIDTTTLVLADGSGVSRYNLVSANHIVQLLLWAYGRFQVFPEFSAALPIGGSDGTLKKRMISSEVRAKARAKTGTLQGVSSLSGYVVTRDNEVLVFSILMNGYVGGSAPYRDLQDRIVTVLSQFSRF